MSKTFREQISILNAAGKTIEAIVPARYQDQLCITLSGDCFALVGARSGYDDDALIQCEDTEFDHREYFRDDLILAFGQQQVDAWDVVDAERQRKRAEWNAVLERKQYEELRAKFEKNETSASGVAD